VHNPFDKPANPELSFIGRDLSKESTLQPNRYRRDSDELYGPVWVYVTLLIEFVILGHLSNQMTNSSKQGSQELLAILS